MVTFGRAHLYIPILQHSVLCLAFEYQRVKLIGQLSHDSRQLEILILHVGQRQVFLTERFFKLLVLLYELDFARLLDFDDLRLQMVRLINY